MLQRVASGCAETSSRMQDRICCASAFIASADFRSESAMGLSMAFEARSWSSAAGCWSLLSTQRESWATGIPPTRTFPSRTAAKKAFTHRVPYREGWLESRCSVGGAGPSGPSQQCHRVFWNGAAAAVFAGAASEAPAPGRRLEKGGAFASVAST